MADIHKKWLYRPLRTGFVVGAPNCRTNHNARILEHPPSSHCGAPHVTRCADTSRLHDTCLTMFRCWCPRLNSCHPNVPTFPKNTTPITPVSVECSNTFV